MLNVHIIIIYLYYSANNIWAQANKQTNDQMDNFFVPRTAQERRNVIVRCTDLWVHVLVEQLASSWANDDDDQTASLRPLLQEGILAMVSRVETSDRQPPWYQYNTTANSKIFSGCNQQRSYLTIYGGIHYVYWQGSTCILHIWIIMCIYKNSTQASPSIELGKAIDI